MNSIKTRNTGHVVFGNSHGKQHTTRHNIVDITDGVSPHCASVYSLRIVDCPDEDYAFIETITKGLGDGDRRKSATVRIPREVLFGIQQELANLQS